jgi:hypothetical protein
MAEVPLSRGRVAIVDNEHYEWLAKVKWYVITPGKCSYAAHDTYIDEKRHCIYMHRLVMGLAMKNSGSTLVDHINGDSLDNRRENLRFATKAQNSWNVPALGGSSKYKGVQKHGQCAGWTAGIKANNVRHYLGLFKTESEAAIAYNEAAVRLHGNFAKLNALSDETITCAISSSMR